MNNTLSVIQLNTYIKRKFEQDFVLKNVSVEGELSNFKRHSSGHIYFTLKDDKAQVSCVMFKTYLTGSEYDLHDGMKVVVKGSVSLYEKSGQYQIYVRKIEQSGIGELYVLFEKLKRDLLKEGLFDQSFKKPIPKYGNKIGIVTSGTGAAIRDIVQVSKRRNPYVELILYPSLVQGESASENIAKGIAYFNQVESVDVIIVGRGGGSIEDLWPFNEEVVARAIFNSGTPVISAVGHETDFTIADFVSDLRAPTPSAAAELAVFDYYMLMNQLKQYKQRFYQNLINLIHYKMQVLGGLKKQFSLKHPRKVLEDRMLHLDHLREWLINRQELLFSEKWNRIEVLKAKLTGKSPLARLEEGYAYITSKGKRISKIEDVEVNDGLNIYVSNGKILSKVYGKEEL